MAILLERVNRAVSVSENIRRRWGAVPDDRHLQALRHHMSKIRLKLQGRFDSGLVHTVRSIGYRVNVRLAYGVSAVGRLDPRCLSSTARNGPGTRP
jgi:DNA-binding response OmpR family regulator